MATGANGYEISRGRPALQITYTFAAGPLAGRTLRHGVPAEAPEGRGPAVQFDPYRNAAELEGVEGLAKGATVYATLAGKPDLEALVAEAEAALAEARARFDAAVAALEPVGFVHEIGCDGPDTYRYLWPEGVEWPAIEARLDRGDLPRPDALRDRLGHDDWTRIAAATGAGAIPANLATYGGWRFDRAGLGAILALHADRLAAAEGRAAARDAAREAKVAAARAEARAAGQPVLLDSWTEECDGSVDECDVDNCRRYALPDGTFRVSRTHTF
jgi:hypothetical protein